MTGLEKRSVGLMIQAVHTKGRLQTPSVQVRCRMSGPEAVPQGLTGRGVLTDAWHPGLCKVEGPETVFARIASQVVGRENGRKHKLEGDKKQREMGRGTRDSIHSREPEAQTRFAESQQCKLHLTLRPLEPAFHQEAWVTRETSEVGEALA